MIRSERGGTSATLKSWLYKFGVAGDSAYFETADGKWSRIVYVDSPEYRSLCFAAGWRLYYESWAKG